MLRCCFRGSSLRSACSLARCDAGIGCCPVLAGAAASVDMLALGAILFVESVSVGNLCTAETSFLDCTTAEVEGLLIIPDGETSRRQ